MSPMPWVKLYTEMLDDPKIGRLPDAIKWRFVSLVLLAGECDKDGYLSNSSEPMTVDDIAWRMRVTREQCETELTSLVNTGLLEDIDGAYLVTKFAERQGRPQSEKRAQWRERKARQRDTQDSHEDVTRESRESHAPRVEKSREELSPNGETATDDNTTEPKPRKKTERQIAVDELESRFASLSGLQKPPRDKSKAGGAARWWNPLGEMWELCGRDTASAWKLIESSYKKLIGEKMTVSAPQSLINTANAMHAQGNGRKVINVSI